MNICLAPFTADTERKDFRPYLLIFLSELLSVWKRVTLDWCDGHLS